MGSSLCPPAESKTGRSTFRKLLTYSIFGGLQIDRERGQCPILTQSLLWFDPVSAFARRKHLPLSKRKATYEDTTGDRIHSTRNVVQFLYGQTGLTGTSLTDNRRIVRLT